MARLPYSQRTPSSTGINVRKPTREEGLKIQHNVIKILMPTPKVWRKADILWFKICDHEVLRKDKDKTPDYPYAWLSLRDFYILLRELTHMSAIDWDTDADEIYIRFRNNNLPPLDESEEEEKISPKGQA